MRALFAILLSCVLSLNFFFYSDEIYGYSTEIVNQNTLKRTYIDSLKQLGYYKSEFKDDQLNFRNAVLHFQSDNNLIVDGIAGKQFRTALVRRLKSGKASQFNDYVNSPGSNKQWIVVNKSKRTLTVYVNKKAIRKYPVALGRIDFITPEGKFIIKKKVVNPIWSGNGIASPEAGGSESNPLGYRWLGLNIGYRDKYGIHGNNNPYSIGQNVSRGCIRMLNEDIEELYRLIPKGTAVWIGTDKQLKKWGVYQRSFID